ncbi:MAG: DUF5110 domain-containing protein [Clostridiales Family XIII bacterium]|jgi:hypothetical protein|nr:DUF5110 domain-containing protein [Clostridiales Family XIII bacterium]
MKKKIIGITLVISLIFSSGAFINVPAVHAAGIASEIVGDVRVQLLSDTLARIELRAPSGGFEDRTTYHIVNRDEWPGPSAVATAALDGATAISTPNYTVVIPNNAVSLTGVYATDSKGREIWRYTSLPSSAQYLPAPGATPKGWAIADNPRAVPAPWGYRPMAEGNDLFPDYNGWDTTNSAPDMFVFVPGGDAKQLRQDFTDLTGKSELIPLKTLGLWHSRYYAYSETSALQWIDKYREEGFPLDYFVVDTDWRVGASLGYAVNTNLFPDMSRFIQAAHNKNVDIMFNDHPEPVKADDGSRLNSLAQPEVIYRNESLKSIFDLGLDVWWYDRNWSTSLVAPFNIPKESFGMYLYQAITADYFEDNKGDAPYARRPLIMGNVDGIDNGSFNRAPDFASHRFSIQWTGDTHGQPSDLRQEIVDVVRSGALTSTPYMSSDIAGHMDVLSPEQWTRWTQYAALSPIIRYHCTAGSNLDRSPWLYGEAAEDIARDYIEMRYRLLPLFYSLSHENYETGLPLVRRLDYNYPGYAESQDDTQYTLGDNILVAPIWESIVSASPAPAAWLSHDGGQPGLSAAFYNNTGLTGEPVLTRVDNELSFNWGTASPAPGTVNADNFSAVWTGDVTTGDFDVKLGVLSDDGVRFYLDGNLVIDNWGPNDSVTRIADTVLEAGSTHSIKVEYYEGSGNAVIRLVQADAAYAGNSRSVFIPDGKWIDVWTGEEYTGPRTINVNHNISTSPVFVRSGSIIPLAENVSYIGEKDWSKIGLDVYPSVRLAGNTKLYEDDGLTVAYKDAQSRVTDLSTSFDNGDVLVNIGAASGSYEGALTSRTWKVRVHTPEGWGALKGVLLDGVTAEAAKISKAEDAVPFSIEGGALDADVYEISLTSNVSVPHELRLSFEHPVAEYLPEYNGIPVDFDVTDTMSGLAVNLTRAGEWDWAHFGADGVDSRTLKNGVADRIIGDINITGEASVYEGYSEFTWTDGNDSSASRNHVRNGLALTDGSFEFDVNVGSDAEKITLYIGGESSSGRLTVSDGTQSGAKLVDAANTSGAYARKITIDASADEPATLHIKYTKTGGSGSIALFAAAVSSPSVVSDVAIQRFVSLEPINSSINLSEDAVDWVHLGYGGDANARNRKAGVNAILSMPLITGSYFRVDDYNRSGDGIYYTDGSNPVSVSGNQNAIAGDGSFQISVPSTDEWQLLKVYLGCWNATNKIEVFDDSGIDLAAYTYTAGGTAAIRCLNVVFRSDEDSSINIKWSRDSGSGNVSFAAYAIYDVDGSDVSAAVTVEDAPAGSLNLSDPKFVDWAHFGYSSSNSMNHKAGVSNMIGNPSDLLGANLSHANDFTTVFSWNDGTVNPTVTGTRDFAYSFDGMKFDIDVQPGIWKFSIYTSVWWGKGYLEFTDENGDVIGVAQYESRAATNGVSEYRKVNLVYSSAEAHTITVRNMPALAFDGHRGNMSFVAVTAERFIDHVSISGGETPNISTELTAKAFVSPDDSLEFISYDGVQFQWQSGDSPNGYFADIEGADTAAYRPVDGDVGKYLRVLASFADVTVSATTQQPVSDLIFDPVFIDGKGAVVTALADRPLNVTLAYYNDGAEALTLTLYAAIYSADGRLKFVNNNSQSVAAGQLAQFNAALDTTNVSDGDYAKVFLWDASMKPVREAFVFE